LRLGTGCFRVLCFFKRHVAKTPHPFQFDDPMKVEQFLAQHHIVENPFGQEDAQTDHVFREFCLDGTHHPAWDKIYGNPKSPSTSVVFGEKGAGKTALRLQIVDQLRRHNRENPEDRTFIIEYDDFNPFLDAFRERLHGRKRRPERVLAQWCLWDHMDAILSLGVRQLVKGLLEPSTDSADGERITPDQQERLPRLQKRDLLLLEALYDHTYDQPARQRWRALKRKLRFSTWKAEWDRALGFVATATTAGLILKYSGWKILVSWWAIAIVVGSWLPWVWRQARLMWTAWRIARQVRVFDHIPNTLRHLLARFERQEIAGQPLPTKDRSDDRYELLLKFQTILNTLGFSNIIVLVDRVDEPHLVNGNAERMRDLLWSMFDNKFLKHPGIGFKMLLPAEVVFFLNREEKQFYERSRLDKQNLIPSLEWTGESLYDIANDRLRACAKTPEQTPAIEELFEDSIGQKELIDVFFRLRVPRHLFKFLYRLIVDHCNRHTDQNPSWQISSDTLQATLALYLRDLDAFDRGLGTG
jgi:hypothetical protein